jgi:hypothetical protein
MTSTPTNSPTSSDALAGFLLRHPRLERALPWVWRSRAGSPFLGLIARTLTRQARTQGLRSLIDELADGCPEDPAGDEFDQRFIAGFAASNASRDKWTAFIKGLSTLDPHIRKGLLRTWIQVAGLRQAQRKAQRLRDANAKLRRSYPFDAFVTPFGACNLSCVGCYTASQLGTQSARLDDLAYVVAELRRLHVAHIMLVGKGEPFFDQASRDLLFAITRRHRDILFSVYTNGTLIESADIDRLRARPNLVPIISVDGFQASNDARRGFGVFGLATSAMRAMKQAGLFFGYISTVFRENAVEITSQPFTDAMADLGCRFGLYSMFLTLGERTNQHMRLLEPERSQYADRLGQLQAAARIPVLDLDGLEAHVGCRAKHGATVSIDPISGHVTPCIRRPVSGADCNLLDGHRPGRLAEILASPAFVAFRSEESGSDCPAYGL